MADDRILKLESWMKRDPDIRHYAISFCGSYDCADPLVLYAKRPDQFDELYDAIETMVEDEPIRESPGFGLR